MHMGIMEGYPRKPIQHQLAQTTSTPSAAATHHANGMAKKWYSNHTKTLLLFLLTNSLSILLTISFSSPRLAGNAGLHVELDAALAASQKHVVQLHRRVSATNAVIDTLIAKSGHLRHQQPPPALTPMDDELTLALGPHTLPFGYTSNLDSDKLFPAVCAVCRHHRDELAAYMSYDVGGDCPSDATFAQWLMLHGCEPLPRRRCLVRGPAGFPDPAPFPGSLWTTPPDTSVVWDPYTCKNYSCLVDRENHPGSYDCKDCFNLAGREPHRWVEEGGELDYTIASVLTAKPGGTVRIGLDIGGGTGTFAARMAERGVTVVTTTLDLDAPFGAFIASRGLVPLHFGAIAGRLPFFDGTLDIVHSMHVLSNWIPGAVFDAALYDIYRVLRPGGLFWLDHFFCTGSELNELYVPMIEKVGFRKLRWNTGRKLDRGPELDEWYLSALLEKPMK